MPDLQSLEFSIKAKTDDAVSSIEKLSNAIDKLSNQKSTAVKTLKDMIDAFKGFDGGKIRLVEKLGTAFKSMHFSKANAKNTQEFVSAINSLGNDSVNTWKKLGETLQSMPKTIKVKADIAKPTEVSAETGKPAETPITKEFAVSIESAQSALNRFSTSKAVSALKTMKDAVADLSKYLVKFAGVSWKAVTFLPKTIGSSFAAKVKQVTSGLGQLFNAMKRIALYRLLRSAIKEFTQGFEEGQKNLYNYSKAMGTAFAPSMDRLASSSLYLKNSLAAMAAPIINAIVPAVEVAINAIVTLMNYFNMLISALTGKGFTSIAKKVGTAWDDAKKGAGGANKAAKELKRTILGFDELNVLNDNNNGAGGGGGGSGSAVDFSDMFEEVEIPETLKDFADRVKEMLKAQDWESLGKFLGDKFNALINPSTFGKLGERVGTVVGGIISTSYHFFKTADFNKVGESIATFLNDALKKINTKDFGRLLVRLKTVIFDVIIGAVTAVDWKEVASKASDFVEGVFKEITDWIEDYDWNQLGKDIGKDIADMIASIKWGDLAKSVWEFIKAAINGIWSLWTGFLESIIWRSVVFMKEKWNIDLTKIIPQLKNLEPKVEDNTGVLIKDVKDKWNANLVEQMPRFKKLEPNVENNAKTLTEQFRQGWSAQNPKVPVKVVIGNAISDVIKGAQKAFGTPTFEGKLKIKTPKVTAIEWKSRSYNGNSIAYPDRWTMEYAAKGAILNGATLLNSHLVAGEAGREAVLPLDRNTQWMDDIASRIGDNGQGAYVDTYNALVDFYQTYVASTVSGMASDMRRQADKDESTTVSVDSITAALARKNMRDGKTVVPVG